MKEYRSAIVDRLGAVMYWCDDMTDDEILDMLDNNPEWSQSCIEITGEEWVYEWV